MYSYRYGNMLVCVCILMCAHVCPSRSPFGSKRTHACSIISHQCATRSKQYARAPSARALATSTPARGASIPMSKKRRMNITNPSQRASPRICPTPTSPLCHLCCAPTAIRTEEAPPRRDVPPLHVEELHTVCECFEQCTR